MIRADPTIIFRMSNVVFLENKRLENEKFVLKYTDSYVLRFARDLNSDTKQYYITRRYYYVFIRVDVVCIFTVQNGHSAKTFRYYYLFFFHYYLFPVQHGWKKTSVTRVMQVLHILLHAFATSCWPTAPPPPPPSWFSVPIRPARVDDDGETRTFLSRRNIRSARPIRPTFCVRSRFGRVVYRSPAAAWYPQKRTTTHNITVSRRRHNNIYRTEPIPCDRVEKNPRRYSLYRGFGISLFFFYHRHSAFRFQTFSHSLRSTVNRFFHFDYSRRYFFFFFMFTQWWRNTISFRVRSWHLRRNNMYVPFESAYSIKSRNIRSVPQSNTCTECTAYLYHRSRENSVHVNVTRFNTSKI